MSARPILSLALGILLLPLSGAASADEVTRGEFAVLVDRAADDPQALERLRRVDEVEGRPVEMDVVLGAATDEQLERRLASLEPDLEGGSHSADARSEAAAILADRRFREADTPKPLKGISEWVAERMRGVTDSIERMARALPGGLSSFWVLIAALVMILSMLVTARLSKNRHPPVRTVHLGDGDVEDPGALLRAAEAAEKGGDLEASVRLRFKAGLLRLARRGHLPRRTSLTSEDISALLHSPTFDRLAATFDRVVYGRHPAIERDVAEARDGWRTVESEVRA